MFDTVATQLTAVKGSIVNGMSAGSHGLCLCRGLQNFPVTQWHRAARPSSGCSHPRSTLVCQWYDLKGINLICWRDTRRMPIFFLPSHLSTNFFKSIQERVYILSWKQFDLCSISIFKRQYYCIKKKYKYFWWIVKLHCQDTTGIQVINTFFNHSIPFASIAY